MIFQRLRPGALASLFCIVTLLAVVPGTAAFGASLEGWSRKMIDKGDVHLEIFERGAVELDLCGLSRPVDGAKADAGGNAVDDGLRELYAGLSVLGGDVEC